MSAAKLLNVSKTSLATMVVLCIGTFLAPSLAAQDVAAGEKVFGKCKACHQVGEKAKNRVGPVLNGVVGRNAGSLEGFKYSKAMSESELVWTEENLAAFLTKPKAFLKGAKMSFGGLKKEEDVASVIAFLSSFQPDGTKAPE